MKELELSVSILEILENKLIVFFLANECNWNKKYSLVSWALIFPFMTTDM